MTEPLNEKALETAADSISDLTGELCWKAQAEMVIRAYLSAADPLIEMLHSIGHQAADALSALLSRAQAAEAERDASAVRAERSIAQYAEAEASLTAARAEIEAQGADIDTLQRVHMDLVQEIEALRKALEPFARWADDMDEEEIAADFILSGSDRNSPCVSALLAAREALRSSKDEQP